MGIEIEVGLENAAKMPRITEETLELESPKGLANPKVRRLLIAGGAVLLGALTGRYLFYRLRESTDDAQVDAHVAPVASTIYGRAAEVRGQDNQPVKAGQGLMRIDARAHQAALTSARTASKVSEA